MQAALPDDSSIHNRVQSSELSPELIGWIGGHYDKPMTDSDLQTLAKSFTEHDECIMHALGIAWDKASEPVATQPKANQGWFKTK